MFSVVLVAMHVGVWCWCLRVGVRGFCFVFNSFVVFCATGCFCCWCTYLLFLYVALLCCRECVYYARYDAGNELPPLYKLKIQALLLGCTCE